MEREVQRPARWRLQGVVNDEAAVCLRPLREDVAAKLTDIRAADQAFPEYQPPAASAAASIKDLRERWLTCIVPLSE